jgi:DNA-binding CsgD family transcriptional regulator
MINLRVAWVLAHEIHGTAWEALCLSKGLDPSSATADDVLGPMSTRITHSGGKPVLPLDDDRVSDLLAELEAEPEIVHQGSRAFMAEVTQIAGLTKQESRVALAIVDGSPIPDGKDYTKPLAKRLNTTPKGIRNAWERAKKKLRDTWAAE